MSSLFDSMREIRRELRRLPRGHRKDIVSAIREGRTVHDSRNAALAAAWAERLTAMARRPRWWVRGALPLTRPRGWRAWLWVLHFVWIIPAIVYAYVRMWSLLPGVWRWVLVGFLAYSALATPFTIRQMLRTYWNAPEAARRNRELAASRTWQ